MWYYLFYLAVDKDSITNVLFLLLKGVFFCYPKLRCKDIESLVLKKEMLKESISFCIFLLEWGLFLCFECCVVAIRQQHYWQVVSSCRGRFIAPTYRNTPTKLRTETRVRWNGYTYIIMWKCVFGEMDMCICLCQNTGAMNRPLRLAEYFVVISWVNVGCLRSVSWLFRGCSLHY